MTTKQFNERAKPIQWETVENKTINEVMICYFTDTKDQYMVLLTTDGTLYYVLSNYGGWEGGHQGFGEYPVYAPSIYVIR